MAVTSIGFDGVMTEAQAALWTPMLGRGGVVASSADLKPTIIAGDRSVQFAAGSAMQHSVRARSDAAFTAQAGTISSGNRTDTVAMRRDWTANASSLVVVPGGTSQSVSMSIKAETPGVGQVDQPLALMTVTAGQQQPTALIDLREFWTPGGTREFASAEARDYWWPNAPVGSQAFAAGILTERTASGWRAYDAVGALTYAGGTGTTRIIERAGSPNVHRVGGLCTLRGDLQRANGTTLAGQPLLATLPSTFAPPTEVNAIAACEWVGGTTFSWRCDVRINGEIWGIIPTGVTWVSLDGISWAA